METRRAYAQANRTDRVLLFVIVVMLVLSAFAFFTYVTMHDIMPSIQHLQNTLVHPRNN